MPRLVPRRVAALLSLLSLSATACGDRDPSTTLRTAVLEAPEGTVAAGTRLTPVRVRVNQETTDRPAAGVTVRATVQRGGGRVEPFEAVTDAGGEAVFAWTAGIAPVANALEIAVAGGAAEGAARIEVDAERDSPLEPDRFGDVDAALTARDVSGSTEDLDFSTDGTLLLLGIPGGLLGLRPDAAVTPVELSGAALVNPLGIATAADGTIWVADSAGRALRRISREGVVTTVLESDGRQPLRSPNFVALTPSGDVLLSDPCLGELIRFDPAADRVEGILEFDLAGEGGPNGFAFGPDGTTLWLLTENTALFCASPGVGLTDPIAGLYRVEVPEGEGFGARAAVVEDFALFGDGVALDAEGNVYAIFDRQENLMLAESAVWVLPEGGTSLRPFLSVHDRVLANLLFGRGEFDARTLWISLLAVPPFTSPHARGVERISIGIPGLTLPGGPGS